MSEELPDLPEDLRELFDAERPPRGPDDAARARLRDRLAPILPGGTGGAPPTPGTTPPAPSGGSGRTHALVALLALLIGLGSGAALHAWLAEPVIEVRTVEVVVRAPPDAAPVEVVDATPIVEPAVLVEPAPERPEREPSTARARVDAGSRDLDLAQENALIERAQTALGRGQPSQALEALREHASVYPRGQLVEEREALWVQALARNGDLAGATERAERFRHRFPSSMLMPAVEASVREAQ